ncbi:PaaI family thioesterase [Novosphingobium bradum]|uniref:PaaI family thioesterase n=1 Tax=Novosphingobium bradum TaxID=1737444 RepID=A0ABV7IM56_9SPHN
MPTDPEALAAQGWQPIQPDSFSRALGPLWMMRGERPAMGFIATEAQTNGHMKTVHGAALMTLADLALGYGVSIAAGTPNSATIQLNLQFVAAPQIGDFVVCYPEVIRVTRDVTFVRATIQVGDRTVANADGIWKFLKPKA